MISLRFAPYFSKNFQFKEMITNQCVQIDSRFNINAIQRYPLGCSNFYPNFQRSLL